jgi:ribosomal protein S18 acetylase RimI-like enzyme
MILNNQNLIFRELKEQEEYPYNLLLLADPSKAIIDDYLKLPQIFIAAQNEHIIGTIVLQSLVNGATEIKNVAVLPELQGQGIGTYLIENAIQIARQMNCNTIQIGTANSSIGQFYLYQKLGFEISVIRENFFIDYYTEKIYENGIQAKHMILLTKKL